MSVYKRVKNTLIRIISGRSFIPRGLFDLAEYFRTYGPIHFKIEKENSALIALSTNFRYGSIITEGKDEEELDRNIKDAILTSFEIPSSYGKEVRFVRHGSTEKEYALA